MKVIEMSVNDGPDVFITNFPDDIGKQASMIADDIDDIEGETVTIKLKLVEMSEKELENLGEFEGFHYDMKQENE